MPRPTKLTPQVQEIICTALERGHTHKIAANKAGIAIDTFYEWRKAYPDFSDAVHSAEVNGQEALVEIWRNAAHVDWHAARDMLARRHPDDWGPREKIEHSGSAEFVVKVVKYSDEDDK